MMEDSPFWPQQFQEQLSHQPLIDDPSFLTNETNLLGSRYFLAPIVRKKKKNGSFSFKKNMIFQSKDCSIIDHNFGT